MIHSSIGVFHVTAAMLSMAFGGYILLARKGSKRHRVAGYVYTSAMLVTNLSAFGLYHLFGTFGPFHVAALVSLFTLIAGIVPAVFKRSKSWLYRHMYWMHYSVFGLYAAFVSEVVTRIHMGIPFFWAVGIGTAAVMFSAAFIIKRKARLWALEAAENMRRNFQKNQSLKSTL